MPLPHHRIKRPSVILSFVFAGLFLLLLVLLAILIPAILRNLIHTGDVIGDRTNITATVYNWLLAICYLMIIVAFATVVLLILLLHCVLKEEVFTVKAITILSAISWCCFAEGLLFLIVSVWFQLALLIFAAACFLGLCLRITCNVIAEGTRYKAENDLTV